MANPSIRLFLRVSAVFAMTPDRHDGSFNMRCICEAGNEVIMFLMALAGMDADDPDSTPVCTRDIFMVNSV